MGEHEHVWEEQFHQARFTGEPSRRCLVPGCHFVTLDAEGCDCGDWGCPECAEVMTSWGLTPGGVA
jgi:hypothetical protein